MQQLLDDSNSRSNRKFSGCLVQKGFCLRGARGPVLRTPIATSAIMCACRRRSPGSAPSLPTPLPITSLPAAGGVALALPSISTLSVAPFPCPPPSCRSCNFLLRLCTPSFVSSRATFLSVTLCLGTPCRCMGSVLVLIAKFASLGHRRILLGGTPLWNAAGAAVSSSGTRMLDMNTYHGFTTCPCFMFLEFASCALVARVAFQAHGADGRKGKYW
jgi:hypothetical protein